MRAKFVILIKEVSKSEFHSDETFIDHLVRRGLGSPPNGSHDYETRRSDYQERAVEDLGHLPESAALLDRDSVIFFVRFPNQSRLIVTRTLARYATFRVIHDELAELESTTEGLIRSLKSDGFRVDDDKVEIYERGQNHVIMTGRVIKNSLREAAKQRPATAGTTIVALTLSVATILYMIFDHRTDDSVLDTSVERLSTAMIAAFLISLVSFIYEARQISRHRTVEWRPALPRSR